MDLNKYQEYLDNLLAKYKKELKDDSDQHFLNSALELINSQRKHIESALREYHQGVSDANQMGRNKERFLKMHSNMYNDSINHYQTLINIS